MMEADQKGMCDIGVPHWGPFCKGILLFGSTGSLIFVNPKRQRGCAVWGRGTVLLEAEHVSSEKRLQFIVIAVMTLQKHVDWVWVCVDGVAGVLYQVPDQELGLSMGMSGDFQEACLPCGDVRSRRSRCRPM